MSSAFERLSSVSEVEERRMTPSTCTSTHVHMNNTHASQGGGREKNLNEDRIELLLMIFLSQTPRWHTQQRFFVVVLFFVFCFALTELKPMALCFLCSTTELPPQSVFLRHHLTTCPRLTQNCGPPASVSLGSRLVTAMPR